MFVFEWISSSDNFCGEAHWQQGYIETDKNGTLTFYARRVGRGLSGGEATRMSIGALASLLKISLVPKKCDGGKGTRYRETNFDSEK